jgi:hypothetical protein
MRTSGWFLLCLLALSACSLGNEGALLPTAAEQSGTLPFADNASLGRKTATATKKPKGQPASATKSPDAALSGQQTEPIAQFALEDFLASPIFGRPTDTSLTVNVVPARTMELFFEYGTALGVYASQTPAQQGTAGVPLETTLTGFQPNTRYYIRVCYEGATGPEQSFQTQRAPGDAFTFNLQGDSHPERLHKEFDPGLYVRTLLSAASDNPDFYFTMGDDFSVDQMKSVNANTVRALYLNQRKWLGLVGAPVFLVNGNHEQAAMANLDGAADNVAVWAQTARNAYYPVPAPDAFYSGDADPVPPIGLLRDYYAFTWGDALFVVIDPYWHSPSIVDNPFGADHGQKGARDLWDNTLGDAQYQWFRRTLENSTARYKFVFTHHVLGTGRGGIELARGYEWGDLLGLRTHRPGWDQSIQQVMASNHVTIFFQGHDHIFAHQVLDGVVYQTLPEPADPNYSLFNADAYQSGDKFPNSGHVRVKVAPDGVTVEYVRSYLDRSDEVAFLYRIGR